MSLYRYVIKDDLDSLKCELSTDNINIVQYKHSLLQEAIGDGYVDIALFLIGKGINVNIKNESDKTALHYCAEYGTQFYEVAKSILKHNGDLSIADIYGNQPLWTATHNSKGRYYDMVELFMEYGANPNHKNNVNKSPLDMVTDRGYNDLIKILTKAL